MDVFLPIDSDTYGDWPSMRIFASCRAFATRIAPGCLIQAKHSVPEHHRLGWWFSMPSEQMAVALQLYYRQITGRNPNAR